MYGMGTKKAGTVAAFACFIFTLLAGAVVAAPDGARVAVFGEKNFPAYNVTPLVFPRTLAADLNALGVPADVLDADALADPRTFSARRYSVLILPYGNAFPQAAFANLKSFHKAGGGFVLSGVPFTHPILGLPNGDWEDLGHSDAPGSFGSNGIGVGGFTLAPSGKITVAPGDPLGLRALHWDWGNSDGVQTLDTTTLPANDTVTPVLSVGVAPVAVIVRHNDAEFPGAMDVWTSHRESDNGLIAAYAETQLLERGALAIFVHHGLLPPAQAARADAILDAAPKPPLDGTVTLPVVPRPYPTLQPIRSVPARHLYVADVRHLTHDETLLVSSLQGIVNRKTPRIYLITHDDDNFWLTQMQAKGETDAPILVSDPLSLVTTFRSEIKGAVVSDPAVYISPCIAVDIAGLDDFVIATPELAQRLGLPVKSDLRGKFKDDADALRYARVSLLPRLNPYLSLCIDPPLLGTQVDDVISSRGMCFWVTGPKVQDRPGADMNAELLEVEKTFAAMPIAGVVRGYWWHGDGVGLDERPGVALGSRYGKVTTVSDYVANFSVTSGIPIRTLTQKAQPPAPPYDPTKVYVAFALSDGDNLSAWRGAFRNLFTDPLLGTFPVAFGIGPSLIDVAPNQAEWYYDHSTPNNEFICDVSGVGYVYPKDWGLALKDRDRAFRSYDDWTQKYMTRLGLKGLRVMEADTSDIARVGKGLPGVSFLMPDYGPESENSYSARTYLLPTGQPVFRAVTYGPNPQQIADQIRGTVGETRPAFVNSFVFLWGARLSNIKDALSILGPDYVAVTPSQLNALYRQSRHQTAGLSPEPARLSQAPPPLPTKAPPASH